MRGQFFKWNGAGEEVFGGDVPALKGVALAGEVCS